MDQLVKPLTMRIAFRTDASIQIGTGHVMRCLTLADAMRERGAQCTFICRSHAGHLLSLIVQRGYHAVALPELQEGAHPDPTGTTHAAWLGTDWATDAADTRKALGNGVVDWLVVDHYGLDRRWEQSLRPCTRHLMAIDDLADRPHDCDLLLDQNLGRTDQDYSLRLNPNTTTLIGPQYALLRPEFAALRPYSLARRANPQFKHLLVTMGGVDKDNATGKVLNALRVCSLPEDLRITVVMGQHAPWLGQVQAQAAQMPRPTHVLVAVSNMAQWMAESDLAIGAAGSTSWERCCLGLPSIQLVLAANQQAIANALARKSAAMPANVGQLENIFREWLSSAAHSLQLHAMSQAAQAITDGMGADRLVELMIKGDQ